ncbi:MAG: hypothetical protein EOP35_19230 [Rubrivivax sp.]|nr:MAG: hypothetical protein EOP35_19230 [Rubrivivax sp.]
MDIIATGVTCDEASAIAKAAEGLGRAAFKSGGFSCKPTDAPHGDTNYTCTKGKARVTFRYGTA